MAERRYTHGRPGSPGNCLETNMIGHAHVKDGNNSCIGGIRGRISGSLRSSVEELCESSKAQAPSSSEVPRSKTQPPISSAATDETLHCGLALGVYLELPQRCL